MIPITGFKDQKIAVFGLGKSGLAAAKALQLGGARITAWDDGEAGRQAARDQDIPVHDLQPIDWSDFSALVLAPGVPLTHPKPHWTVLRAKAAGVEVIGDTELFFRQKQVLNSSARIIAITGTNGKSTTTALAAHLLKSGGFDVAMGGNIGKPVLELAPFHDDRIYVLEFSSFQIDLTPSLAPDVAVLLNISPDHIDRHGSLQNYARVKGRIFAKVKAGGLSVIGMDDALSASLAANLQGPYEKVPISNTQWLEKGISAQDGKLYHIRDGDVTASVDLRACPGLRGRHNWQNAAAAFAIGQHFGMTPQAIESGFATFPGLAHRMEPVGRLGPILFINDSKATNAESAGHALSAFDNIYWIAGGRAKTGGIEELVPYFSHIRRAYLIGEAANDFAAVLTQPPAPHPPAGQDAGPSGTAVKTMPEPVACEQSGTLEMAVAAALRDARQEADKAAVILLSPACASFDQYQNFEQRGEHFKQLVAAIPGIQLTTSKG